MGPFNDEAELSRYMAGGDDPRGEFVRKHLKLEVSTAFTRSHDSVFTHGEMIFERVLVDRGKLSGIIDWQFAAFMPTYWEYVKAIHIAWSGEAKEICGKVWGDEFEEELEAEK